MRIVILSFYKYAYVALKTKLHIYKATMNIQSNMFILGRKK